MGQEKDKPEFLGPRAGSRVLDILVAVAQTNAPQSLRQLTDHLDLPRASLHRLLRSLQASGFLIQKPGGYALGPKSYTLGHLINRSAPASEFPDCARLVLEWLAGETNETVILGMLSEQRTEIVYADVILADSPLRYAVPSGDRRPLYSSATGKSVLAFMPPEEQERYIAETRFEPITPYTTRKDQIGDMLATVRRTAVIHDKDGHFVGAGAIASPIFDRKGAVFASIVVAGPNERLEENPVPVEDLVREAGESISRILRYDGDYPPPWPGGANGVSVPRRP